MRAPAGAARPAWAARWMTEAGTYTDPAHNPMIETSRYAELRSVRRRYGGAKIERKARPIVQSARSRTLLCHRAGSRTPRRIQATRKAGVPPNAKRARQPKRAPMVALATPARKKPK